MVETEEGVVGYTIPFEDQTGPHTQLKYLNPETLFLEALVDPLLRGYKTIVITGVDKRSAWTDVTIGILDKVKKARHNQIKIILTAESTEPVETFQRFFGSLGVVQIDGSSSRLPVDILHLTEPAYDYVEAAVECLIKLTKAPGSEGDVLVFLTDKKDIHRFIKTVNDQLTAETSGKIVLAPYHSNPYSPPDFSYDGKRHVAVTDNDIDPLSIRMELAYVIDCGFSAMRWFDSIQNKHSTIIQPLTKSQAQRRANLAGSYKKSGQCFRLYTHQTASKLLKDTPTPGVLGESIASIILKLKALGIDNIARSFKFVPPPPPSESIAAGLSILYSSGALDDVGKITNAGTIMAELPVTSINMAKFIAISGNYGCTDEVLRICACSLAGGISFIFYRPSGKRDRDDAEIQHDRFRSVEGDHFTMLNVFSEFYPYNNQVSMKKEPRWAGKRYLNYQALSKAVQYYEQLKRYSQTLKIGKGVLQYPSGKISDRILSCLVQGYFRQVARRTNLNEYELFGTNKGERVELDRDSIMSTIAQTHPHLMVSGLSNQSNNQKRISPWVIYEHLTEQEESGTLTISGISSISRSLLEPYYQSIDPNKKT